MTLSACDVGQDKQIEWQLPIPVPEDPHRLDKQLTLPAWAKVQGEASFTFLEKRTARVYEIKLDVGKSIHFKKIKVDLLGIATGLRTDGVQYIDDVSVDNPAVFVSIYEQETLIYKGWLYKNFPELFGPERYGWTIWLKNTMIRPPESTKVTGSLSSAG
ncbi:MAG: DUF2155 domain-containing protein [Mariprofundaceae bacterium]|nr:DUF2155 domain-containing protein [Mariprofundaceae bacterium]